MLEKSLNTIAIINHNKINKALLCCKCILKPTKLTYNKLSTGMEEQHMKIDFIPFSNTRGLKVETTQLIIGADFYAAFWILLRPFFLRNLFFKDLMMMARWSGRAMIQQMQIPYKPEGNSGSDDRARSFETPKQKLTRRLQQLWTRYLIRSSAQLAQSHLLPQHSAQ